jgi:protein-disulfide reductase (glutathione)
MPRFVHALLALVLMLPIAAALAAADHSDVFNGAEINWRDPKSGIYEASKSGKPVILVFHATWCSACKRYRAVFQNPGIVAASKDFVMILADADKDKELNSAFSPDGAYVPRTLFIDSEGEVSDKFVGKDAKYPHTIDVDDPSELLALMLKAKASGFGRGTPSEGPAGKDSGAADQRT